jgi:hypothetical protein
MARCLANVNIRNNLIGAQMALDLVAVGNVHQELRPHDRQRMKTAPSDRRRASAIAGAFGELSRHSRAHDWQPWRHGALRGAFE